MWKGLEPLNVVVSCISFEFLSYLWVEFQDEFILAISKVEGLILELQAFVSY